MKTVTVALMALLKKGKREQVRGWKEKREQGGKRNARSESMRREGKKVLRKEDKKENEKGWNVSERKTNFT